MRIDRIGVCVMALALCSSAVAQNTNLTRPEVAAIKAKLVAVQQAMGEDPVGYLKESEDFNLPTEISTAEGGKFWPISASVYLNYTDRAVHEGMANAEQAAKDLEAKYAAAVASGDPNAIVRMSQEAMRLGGIAAAAGMSAAAKEDMSVDVQFNSNPYATIDPDGVVFESPGVIALRDAELASDEGSVTVYFDPVALAETETLSSLELRTPEGGVGNKTGVFNIVITLQGTLADAESWAQSFDTGAILAVIDRQ